MLTLVRRVAVLITAMSPIAAAQSFNVDVGDDGSQLPSSSYGAAAQQPGVWNAMPTPPWNATDAHSGNLVDVDGNATSVHVDAFAYSGLGGSDIGITTMPGEIGRLLLDGIGGASLYNEVHFTITGLLPGAYEVWTYAGPGTTILVGGAAEPGLNANWAPSQWQGYPVEGRHFVRHHVNVSAVLDIQATWPGWREILGIQLVRLEGAPFRGTCLGDGSGSACPCDNLGAPGRGCATSFGPGALLAGSGTASVTNDSLALTVDGVSNTVVSFFQGTQASAAGAGVPFGDGLRCATGTVIRLGSKQAVANVAHHPGAGDVPLSMRGAIPPFGGTRIYQVWFRNAAAFCTSATFNWSSGLAVSWAP
jgi:hypothetical protein